MFHFPYNESLKRFALFPLDLVMIWCKKSHGPLACEGYLWPTGEGREGIVFYQLHEGCEKKDKSGPIIRLRQSCVYPSLYFNC